MGSKPQSGLDWQIRHLQLSVRRVITSVGGNGQTTKVTKYDVIPRVMHCMACHVEKLHCNDVKGSS